MTSDVTFPVSRDTVVSVTCEDGYVNTGDNTVTCYSDTTFTIASDQPKCEEGKGDYTSLAKPGGQ